ncbi:MULTISPECIES: hypothetical protein [Candidatus Cardinium]|uniref:hypothetical protein n=1 Tax=Candidatus Cardinium TaxID=273135 RepID=UPI001FAAC534|nr:MULTISPECIES: hypothetical protein [Cardinium]
MKIPYTSLIHKAKKYLLSNSKQSIFPFATIFFSISCWPFLSSREKNKLDKLIEEEKLQTASIKRAREKRKKMEQELQERVQKSSESTKKIQKEIRKLEAIQERSNKKQNKELEKLMEELHKGEINIQELKKNVAQLEIDQNTLGHSIEELRETQRETREQLERDQNTLERSIEELLQEQRETLEQARQQVASLSSQIEPQGPTSTITREQCERKIRIVTETSNGPEPGTSAINPDNRCLICLDETGDDWRTLRCCSKPTSPKYIHLSCMVNSVMSEGEGWMEAKCPICRSIIGLS